MPGTPKATGPAARDGAPPPSVLAEARRHVGNVLAVEPLGGPGGSAVVRVRGTRGTVVAKGSDRDVEARVYERVAPTLRAHGVPIPACHWVGRAGASWWSILEHVPEPLPRARWLADPAVLGALARLHAATVDPAADPPAGYVPAWDDRMAAAVLARLPAATAPETGRRLEILRAEADGLFAPHGPISGDPNPGNWGLRAGGEVVLFDWERYGRGAPALDLAITLPGLGDAIAYRAVAEGYLAAGGGAGTGPDRLARQVAVAKVWSVVEFVGSPAVAESERGRSIAADVVTALPGWLRSLA